MTGCPSVLELLHPDGNATRAAVFGTACPERLRPRSGTARAPWDLVLVAPGPHEHGRDRIASTARAVAEGLAPDGLAYVLVSPAFRGRWGRALRGAGLIGAGELLHLPDVEASEFMLPLDSSALRAAADRLPAGPRGRVVRAGLRCPGTRAVLARWHRAVGMVARRPGGRPVAAWLADEAGDRYPGIAFVRVRWRLDRARAVIHALTGTGHAMTVTKLAIGAEESGDPLRQEAEALSELGPDARGAGAKVPAVALGPSPGGCTTLRLEFLPGSSAASVILRRPGAGAAVLAAISEWLEAWSRKTCRPARLDATRIQAWILGPARRLSAELPGGTEYLTWLEGRCRVLEGRELPLVATHGDLTMANVLIQSDGGIGVLDWEAASPLGLPLRDFVYAAVDATAAQDRYRDRAAAFDRCFGRANGPVATALGRLRRAIDLPSDFATVSFHACWLQHAEDEARKRRPGEPRPFLECVRRAAVLRDAV